MRTLDHKMQEAMELLVELQGRERDPRLQRLYARLFDVAEGVQENQRTIDVLKTQIEDLRRAVGVH